MLDIICPQCTVGCIRPYIYWKSLSLLSEENHKTNVVYTKLWSILDHQIKKLNAIALIKFPTVEKNIYSYDLCFIDKKLVYSMQCKYAINIHESEFNQYGWKLPCNNLEACKLYKISLQSLLSDKLWSLLISFILILEI